MTSACYCVEIITDLKLGFKHKVKHLKFIIILWEFLKASNIGLIVIPVLTIRRDSFLQIDHIYSTSNSLVLY
jgi:hypothetical protein